MLLEIETFYNFEEGAPSGRYNNYEHIAPIRKHT